MQLKAPPQSPAMHVQVWPGGQPEQSLGSQSPPVVPASGPAGFATQVQLGTSHCSLAPQELLQLLQAGVSQAWVVVLQVWLAPQQSEPQLPAGAQPGWQLPPLHQRPGEIFWQSASPTQLVLGTHAPPLQVSVPPQSEARAQGPQA